MLAFCGAFGFELPFSGLLPEKNFGNGGKIGKRNGLVVMRITATLIAACILFSSCATIITRKRYRMSVRSNAADAHIIYADSTYRLPVIIRVRRSKGPLHFRFEGDGMAKDVVVKARPNPAFLIGNVPWLWRAPVAFLIDFTNQKRFTYGRNIFLDTADTNAVYSKSRIIGKEWRRYWTAPYVQTRRGDVVLKISLPLINGFLLQPAGEPQKEVTGCLGFGLSGSYAYRDGRSFSLSTGVSADFEEPFPVTADYVGLYEQLTSLWLGVTHDHHFHRATLSYGLAFSRNSWSLRNGHDMGAQAPVRQPETKHNYAIGPICKASFRLNRILDLGISYRASLLSLDGIARSRYEHVLSLDVTVPVMLVRGR